jgi:hypothetical protein
MKTRLAKNTLSDPNVQCWTTLNPFTTESDIIYPFPTERAVEGVPHAHETLAPKRYPRCTAVVVSFCSRSKLCTYYLLRLKRKNRGSKNANPLLNRHLTPLRRKEMQMFSFRSKELNRPTRGTTQDEVRPDLLKERSPGFWSIRLPRVVRVERGADGSERGRLRAL